MEAKIEPGLITRIVTGGRYALTGRAPGWFGAGEPQRPVAPAEVAGRQFNLPVSVNLSTTTKIDGLSFTQLRGFADACDIVRLLIETRKDQLCGLGWTIQPIEVGPPGTKPQADPRIASLTAFFRSPDGQHSWSEWLRMVLEDMLVLDAPALYVQRTFGGGLFALRPIDGATIKRLIDDRGWMPPPPSPAYQQVLRGMPAINYTDDELIYKPRNVRTHRIYGCGPVEQIVVTMQLLLSRQASSLEYYQSGNLPEGFLTAGKDWTPDQIASYQAYLDTMLSGNFAERRKVRVAPENSKWQAAKEPALKSDFDEWLARIACFAFGYPPSAFVRDMNRSTSESAKQAGDEEGVNPIRAWVKELLDGIIQRRMGHADLEFAFCDKEAQDPMQRAQIDQIYLAAGVLLPDEVRADLGKAPLSNEQRAQLAPTPPAAGDQPAEAGEPEQDSSAVGDEGDDPAAKLAKATNDSMGGNEGVPFDDGSVDLDRPAAEQSRTELTAAIAAALELASEQAAADIALAIENGATDVDVILAQVTMEELSAFESDLVAALTNTAVDAAIAADTALGVEVSTSLINQRAVEWAKSRAAELIGKDASGGQMLDATRNMIRKAIEDALANGLGSRQLAKILRDEFAFSADRAQMIALTEIANASINGSLQSWIASGTVVSKRWLLAENACTVCQANADQGEIPLLAEFASGDMGPAAHPRCRCSLIPITRQ